MLPFSSRVSPVTYHSVVAVRYPDLRRSGFQYMLCGHQEGYQPFRKELDDPSLAWEGHFGQVGTLIPCLV